MKASRLGAALLALGGVLSGAPPVVAAPLAAYRAPTVARAVRAHLEAAFAGRPAPAATGLLTAPAGLFVTLETPGGANRACWGSLAPRESTAAAELRRACREVLSHDYRQAAVSPAERAGLRATVSFVGQLRPLGSPWAYRPRAEGLLLRAGNRGGLLLPGEALTVQWALDRCRRKAGLRADAPARLYAFDAVRLGPWPIPE